MLIKLKEFLNGSSTALGATAADEHMKELRESVASGTLHRGELILLDFKDIAAVNGSYIKGTALWLFLCGQLAALNSDSLSMQRHTADPRPCDIFVCVSSLSRDVKIEFQEFLRPRRIPLLFARRFANEKVEAASLLGYLDSALRATLEAVLKRGKVTAPELHAAFPNEKITITAWNNRLNDLYALRLVQRTKAGRAWEYEPLAKEITWE